MKEKFVLILPNIRSAHNVGAMFRTADGAGVDKIYLVGYTPNPPHPQLDKVSLGAEKWMPWEKVARLGVLLKKLSLDFARDPALAAGKKMGYNIVYELRRDYFSKNLRQFAASFGGGFSGES